MNLLSLPLSLLALLSAAAVAAAEVDARGFDGPPDVIDAPPERTRRLRFGANAMEHVEDLDSYTEEAIFAHAALEMRRPSNGGRAGSRIWDEDDEEEDDDFEAPVVPAVAESRRGLRG